MVDAVQVAAVNDVYICDRSVADEYRTGRMAVTVTERCCKSSELRVVAL